jgi:hypothetical protein
MTLSITCIIPDLSVPVTPRHPWLVSPAGTSMCRRSVGSTRLLISSKMHPPSPVSDKMGFVVTTPSVPGALVTTDRQPLLLMPPAEGYFMVHTGDTWQRLVIQDPLKGPGTSG